MLARTPYSVGPYGADRYPRALGPSQAFADEGFIFVYQDVRGRFMSEGDFVHMTPSVGSAGAAAADESTDTYDTIEWLINHIPHNNRTRGHVGCVVSRILYRRSARQGAPRAEGGIAAGAAG